MLTTEKAPILGQDGAPLGAQGQVLYEVESSDTTVATISWDDWRAWVYAQAEGLATITATRIVDGAVATVDVLVEDVDPEALPPFSITLGTPVAK